MIGSAAAVVAAVVAAAAAVVAAAAAVAAAVVNATSLSFGSAVPTPTSIQTTDQTPTVVPSLPFYLFKGICVVLL